MPWWGWLVLGIGLLGVEMFVIDAQFYLVFLGVSAAIVGLLGLAGVPMPEWPQWLVFAALAARHHVRLQKPRLRARAGQRRPRAGAHHGRGHGRGAGAPRARPNLPRGLSRHQLDGAQCRRTRHRGGQRSRRSATSTISRCTSNRRTAA